MQTSVLLTHQRNKYESELMSLNAERVESFLLQKYDNFASMMQTNCNSVLIAEDAKT